MKKSFYLFILLLQTMVFSATAQSPSNTSCGEALTLCPDLEFDFNIEACEAGAFKYYFKFHVTQATTLQIGFTTGASEYKLTGPFTGPTTFDSCALIGHRTFDSTFTDTPLYYTIGTTTEPLTEGYYILSIAPADCNGELVFNLLAEAFGCEEELPCENCIGSFAPEAGKKYIVTAWAKEDNAPNEKLAYTYPFIVVDFIGAGSSTDSLYPTGYIIDGWQRIEQEFTIPVGTVQLDIKLNCATGDCYFDDIRVLPYDGSMKSYVYDPVTLRLAAELDERHYATFYEYDEEGKLMRIKKETEKGIMTIQESKTSVPKQ